MKRTVVTGMGVIAPNGDTPASFYENLIAGKSGIVRMQSFDTSQIKCKIGGDLSNYDWKSKMETLKDKLGEERYKKLKKISKTAPFSTKLSMLSALEAWLDSGLQNNDIDSDRVCALIGGHNFHDNYIVNQTIQFIKEPEYIDALMGIVTFDTDIIASICEVLELKGPMYTVGGTCTSSGIALRNAVMEIRYGDSDVALAGGAVLDVSKVGYQALSMINAISYVNFNDAPEKASRPFDTRREGFVPAHGTGFLVIEELEHALKRGAKIYAEILTVEASNDANHLSNPSVEGQSKLMTKALEKALVKPEEIDYINCHATSTPLGDKIEISSIKKVFGKHAYNLKVNATKSMIGHTCWTAPTVELIAAIMQMNNGILHPSINIDEIDPEIDIDVCANRAVKHEVNYFMKNSFGFGGFNCCIVAKKWSGK